MLQKLEETIYDAVPNTGLVSSICTTLMFRCCVRVCKCVSVFVRERVCVCVCVCDSSVQFRCDGQLAAAKWKHRVGVRDTARERRYNSGCVCVRVYVRVRA